MDLFGSTLVPPLHDAVEPELAWSWGSTEITVWWDEGGTENFQQNQQVGYLVPPFHWFHHFSTYLWL
jgi:hypothetical protein